MIDPEVQELMLGMRAWQVATNASDNEVLRRVCGYAIATRNIANKNGNDARALQATNTALTEQLKEARQQLARAEMDLMLLRVQTQEVVA